MANIDPLLEPPTSTVSGHVYDVGTGPISTVIPAVPMYAGSS